VSIDAGGVIVTASTGGIVAGRGAALAGYNNVFYGTTGNLPMFVNNGDSTAGTKTVVSIAKGGSVDGTITSDGTTVLYNAFTGAHYANIAPGHTIPNDTGKVMSIVTDSNNRVHSNGEIIYQVGESTTANSPNVLGSYSGQTDDIDNLQAARGGLHLVAAAGNGDTWVIDNGTGNINVGDPMMSSSVVGYAMRDPKTFATSHIFGKAAESVDWSTVTTTVGGVKVKKISVLFSFYDQENITGTFQAQNLNVAADGIFGGNLSVGA
jgi:hypothetical protein